MLWFYLLISLEITKSASSHSSSCFSESDESFNSLKQLVKSCLNNQKGCEAKQLTYTTTNETESSGKTLLILYLP